MAEPKQSFPIIAAGVWWKLRDQFKRTLPSTVDSGYLATVLGVEVKTAKNILPAIRAMGLIDENGKPTERGNQWRFDEDYAQVCQEIREALYPQSLRDAVPDPANNLIGVQRWFQRQLGVGEAAAKQMARVYQMLADADLGKKPDGQGKDQPKKRERVVAKPSSAEVIPAKPSPTQDQAEREREPRNPPAPPIETQRPALHVDVQIHIASDASLEQIDKIFESMAKHLYAPHAR